MLLCGFVWRVCSRRREAERRAAASSCHAAILPPSVSDACHVAHGFRASHISVFHHGVVIVLWCLEVEDEGCHVIPTMLVLAVFLRQSHGVTDVEVAAVIACEDEELAFGGVAYVLKVLAQLGYVTCCGIDVFFRVVHLVLCQSEVSCRCGHYLHQSSCACP